MSYKIVSSYIDIDGRESKKIDAEHWKGEEEREVRLKYEESVVVLKLTQLTHRNKKSLYSISSIVTPMSLSMYQSLLQPKHTHNEGVMPDIKILIYLTNWISSSTT